MAEYFDILDENGAPTGQKKPRDEVHRDGDWHPSVHIWIVRNSKILLQRRRRDKESFPGMLDLACTGHVDAGETYSQAAVRELKEELNIEADEKDFIYLFTQKLTVDRDFGSGRFISNEINKVYLLDPKTDISSLAYQESEIEELIWTDINAQPTEEFCIPPKEWNKALNIIKKHI